MVGMSKSMPVYAKEPIIGGSAPITAPAKVLYELFCFIGRYTQRYENQTVLEIKKVYGTNY
jgi:hypothetical protein